MQGSSASKTITIAFDGNDAMVCAVRRAKILISGDQPDEELIRHVFKRKDWMLITSFMKRFKDIPRL
jgi:hypothetical protein